MSNLRRVTGLVRGVAVALALVLLGGPAGAQLAISESEELAWGRVLAAELIGRFGFVADPEWLGFLGNLRDRLVPFSGRPAAFYRVGILEEREPNAISVPGWIFVTTGLIRLNVDVDTWAFVLAHEIAHTAQRHLAQHVARYRVGQWASNIIVLLGGNPALRDLAQVLLQISTLGFARELELEADREALRMLVESGFDPQAAQRALAWFNEVTGRRQQSTHWAGTHPGFLDRMRSVERAYEEFAARNLPLRVRHFRVAEQVGPVVLRPQRLVELRDAWHLWMVAENTLDRRVPLGVMAATLRGPEGELTVRFFRSTLPGEVPPRGKVEGLLVFEKRGSALPTALVLPVGEGQERVEAAVDLKSGGIFTPTDQVRVLPRPPALP